MDGIILIDKPSGWTSHDVCKKISRVLDKAKVGHSGTLDPFATGLLIVAVNKATKALLYANFSYKTYVATLKLGQKTKTGDLTSEIEKEAQVPKLNKEDIEKVLKSFEGKSTQIPPMTSAKHYNGVKLYVYAQQGVEVERPSQNIDIKYIKLLSYDEESISFQCLVSSGTYIRVLGEDIAAKLNTVGHLTSLRRIAFGENEQIKVEQASTIDDIDPSKILPVINFIDLPHLEVDEITKRNAIFGQNLKLNTKAKKVLLVNNNEAIAIYEKVDIDTYHCERGLW